MSILTSIRNRRFRKTMAAGLVPLLLLAVLPGCVARHMPNWEKVESLPAGTRIDVQLYKAEARKSRSGKGWTTSRTVKGHFLSASENSLLVSETPLTDQHGKSVYEEIQRKQIRKVLAKRLLEKRLPGWVALGIGLAAGVNFFRAEADFIPGYQVLFGLAIPIGISIPFFLGSKMGGIYEVPPNHRDWYPQGTSSPPAKGETPKAGEGNIK